MKVEAAAEQDWFEQILKDEIDAERDRQNDQGNIELSCLHLRLLKLIEEVAMATKPMHSLQWVSADRSPRG